MVQFNFTYDPSISVEQRVGFELAAMIWGSYLTDDITVNLHIASSDHLGTDGQAVGGAIPLFHEQTYGVYQEYAAADATSDTDAEALASQQEGNTVDFLVDGQVIDGNTDILLTSAQAKALGMDEGLTLDDGGTWDRNLVDAEGLDGYILVSNSFDWNYDYTRSGDAPEGTLDFMSMALHEIGHQLGFVSSLDGTLNMNTLYSGETQAEGFSVLDLFRHSIDSTEVENSDGAVTDLSLGQNSYFSTDGGETNLADFANGDDYQASHWKRMQVALGIMDPTLAYKERVSLNHLDLQAMDVLGWDINYSALDTGLDLDALLLLAENKVEASLGLSVTALDSSRGGGEHGDLYTLGYGEWWAIFEKHVLELGYGEWWAIFEMGYSEWQQQLSEGGLELGYGEWWQAFEANVLELGYGEWWQTFESDMLQLGYGEWWQLLELGYGEWWQKLETFFSTLDTVDGNAATNDATVAIGGVGGREVSIHRGGEADDIIAGNEKQDRINAGAGDDLIDGKEGHDVIWGEAGRDMIYGQDGHDLIYGGDDDDLLLGEAGDDELHGEAGHDIASGGSGDDIVTGGEGRDDLKGGWGRDVLDGGDGNDRLEGEANNDIVIGGKGRDQVNGGGGNDLLYGDNYLGEETLKQLRRLLKQQPTGNQTPTSDPDVSAPSYNPLRVEAEDMLLSSGYEVYTGFNADSGDIIRTTSTGTATTTFTGTTGQYLVVARYLDRYGEGQGSLEFGVNGKLLDSWTLDRDDDRYYTRTVGQAVDLRTGDQFTITGTADGVDYAYLDYLEFIALDNLIVTELETDSDNTSSRTNQTTTAAVVDDTTIRVEAESMALVGDYKSASHSFASDGKLIELATNQGAGKALTAFSGETGFYNIVVGYYDENDDGIAQLSTSLNGVKLDDWQLDQNLGTDLASADNFVTRTIASGAVLSTGDIFEIAGLRGEGTSSDELARVDYIEFVKVDTPTDNAATSTSAPANINANLVAHWTFDDASDNTVTDSIGGLSGTLFNTEATDREKGVLGKALNFDGVGEHGLVENAASLTLGTNNSDFSVSFWFKLEEDATGQWRKILHKGETHYDRTFGMWLRPGDNRLHYRISTTHSWNEGGDGQTSLTLDTWNHISYVKEGNKLLLYLNGQLDHSVTLQGEVLANSGPIRLGSEQLDASLDDLRLYDRSLTTQEISLLSQGETGASAASDLVAHWTFDETSGSVVGDQTGAHNATLMNSVTNDSQWVIGELDGALKLDGVDDYVAIADSSEINLDIHSQRTVSLWFKADDTTVADRKQVLYEEGGGSRGLNIYLHDGKLYVGGWNATTSQSDWQGTFLRTGEIISGQWHHVALVLDGDTQVSSGALKAYLDGEKFATGSGSQLWSRAGDVGFGAVNDATRFHDGSVSGSGGHAFAGSLDDAYIYNRALDAGEIGTLVGRDNDLIQGGAGDDIAFGGDGNDVIYGESMNDNSSTLKGSHTYNGHTYLLSQVSNWHEAQAEAKRLGGNLVTLNSAAEEAWLQATFGSVEDFWTGLNDEAVEGQFEWVSGEAVTYTNWSPNEGVSSPQDYGVLNFGNGQWDDAYASGTWDHNGVWQDGLRGIIEINTTQNDTLFGDSGNDNIYGQAGNDTLYGETLAASLSEGLVVHWAFDEVAGTTTADTTGKTDNIGFLLGNVSWTEGKLGGAVQFDGSTSRVSASDSAELDITHQLTLSSWVKADQFRDYDGLITKGETGAPYSLMLMADGSLRFESNYDYIEADWGYWQSDRKLSTGQWHHVAATYDGEALRFYIDGQLDSNVVYTDINFATNDQDLIVGAQLPGGDEYFDGALDDLRVYNRALSTVEVATLATSAGNSGSVLNVAKDAIYHNGSYYLLTSDNLIWEEAQAQAQSVGGNLVTINDAAEETWLRNTFGTSEWLWIGINDKAVEGQFEWVSGEAVTYTNWKSGEPNNDGGDEDYGIMNYGDQWADANDAERYHQRGIIEIKGVGADNLKGGVGNDTMVGGLGSDILDGTDAIAAGYLERDTVLGGGGADTFIVGSASQAYYLGAGNNDYVLIKDFNAAEDVVQLHGSASDYTQQQQGNDIFLIRVVVRI